MLRQNVVVIMSDEHNPRILGCAGHPFVKTPNLDALAARGLRFTSAYTPSPICVPARAAFATGKRVHQIEHWDNAMPYAGQPPGWGHILQQHGVCVESIGKLHYRHGDDLTGFDAEHLPMYVLGGGLGMAWTSIRDPYHSAGPTAKRMLGDEIGAGESTYNQYDREVTARAVQWLREASERSKNGFVLYVGLVAPHFPLMVPKEFYDLYPLDSLPEPKLTPASGYQRHPWVEEYANYFRDDERFTSPLERRQAFAAYFGLCSFLDHNVGQILRAVESSGLSDNTTVIYTSDHGDNLGTRGLWGKSTFYQESAGVPMLMAGPGIQPGICETPVDLLDLYPTILAAAGVPPEPYMADRPGQDLRDMALAPYDPERVVFSEYHAAGSNSAGYMIRQGRWKFHYYVGHSPELFDLHADPQELRNMADEPEMAHIVTRMEAALRQLCDPEALDARAKAAQRALLAKVGGAKEAIRRGVRGATPVPAAG